MKKIFKLFIATVCLSGVLATTAQAANATNAEYGPSYNIQAPVHNHF